jgi:general stress protein 26
MKYKLTFVLGGSILFLFMLFASVAAYGQNVQSRDTLLIAARDIMAQAPYCALITIDSAGGPQVRTMNPFSNTEGFVIWFATSRSSAKVKEIRANPRVSVYFADHVNATGYVTISGRAEVIDDRALLIKMKRGYWDQIPGWQELFVLIKIVPQQLEVIDYKHKVYNDPQTFRAPVVVF